jgi:S-DNA-T family DNA segregation ATPase FtsK/SpoIIIE
MQRASPLDVTIVRAARFEDVTLHLSDPDVTVGAVGAAVGLAPGALAVDGCTAPAATTVGAAGVRRGSVLGPAPARPSPSPVAVLRWVGGVDAGASVPLTPGVSVLGRAPGVEIRRADPAVAPYSALLDVQCDGSVRIRPVAAGVVAIGAGRWRAGAGVFDVVLPRPVVPVPTGPCRSGEWTVPLARPPRPVAVPPPGPVTAAYRDDATPARTAVSGLATSLLSLAGGIVATVLFGQVAFLLLGGTGAVASIGAWWAQHRRGRRQSKAVRRRVATDRARFQADVADCADAAAAWCRHRAVELIDAIEIATRHDRALWERRPHHDDFLAVVVGRGRVPWAVPVDGGVPVVVELDDVPVTVRLEPGVVVGVVGAAAAVRAVARSLVVQLAVTSGPADVALSIVADDAPADWAWTAWLPHAAALGERMDGRTRVLVVDAADALSARTSMARTVLASEPAATGIVVARHAHVLPACCTHVIDVAEDGPMRLVDLRDGIGLDVVLGAGASVATATAAARALARFDDPELVRPDIGLPAAVDLRPLLGPASLDPVAIAAAWAAGDGDLRAPLAVAADGIVEIDLIEHGPHALVAGTTGAGKSELLRALVVGLAVRASPRDVTFVLVDYKGGSAFDACAGLPHVVGVVTDLDERLAERALRSLRAELRRREEVLRTAAAVDIDAYRRSAPADDGPMPRLVVVIDEFAGLAADLPDFLAALVGVAQRGRGLGVHLVLATQRPAGVVNDDVRANTNLRIALRVQDATDSMDVIGTDDAARLARDRPGRAIVRLGAGDVVPVQVAAVSMPAGTVAPPPVEVAAMGSAPPLPTSEGPTVLERLVASCRAAAESVALPPSRRPWLDPLPDTLSLDTLPVGAVALADDPDAQAQHPIGWDPSAGHLLLSGAPGSGTTTALASLALAAAGRAPASDLHLYVVDMGVGDLQPLSGLPHCGGVVRAAERERLVRLVRRLRSEVDSRRSAGRSVRPDIVVVIDGLEALRSIFDDPAGYPVLDALDGVIVDGPDVGVRVVATVDRAGALPGSISAGIGQRWVFRLADPGDARSFGVSPARLRAIPPGRAVMTSTGLDIQLARPEPSLVAAVADVAATWNAAAGGPAPIGVLPPIVRASSLPAPTVEARPWLLPVGIGDSELEPASLVVHGGDHVLVTGRARTGRSTALVLLGAAIRPPRPDAVIGAVAYRPSPVVEGADLVATEPAALPTVATTSVVLVDDAELVADDGTLAAVLARPDAFVVAAGHPDALRSAYGHWTHVVRRSRLGIVLQPDVDVDGDLLGAVLPRRQPVPSRPGCGYLVVDGRAELVQLAHIA